MLTFMTLFPIYWCFLTGIRSKAEIFSFPPKLYQFSIYWQNFTSTLFKGPYGMYLRNSLIIASGNTILVTSLAVLAAYSLSRYNIKGKKDIFFWTITNRMAPPAAFMLPIFILFSKFLKIGNYNLYDTHIGVIMVYCLFNLPFAVWLLKGIIDGIYWTGYVDPKAKTKKRLIKNAVHIIPRDGLDSMEEISYYGDSGSLWVTENNYAVALHFAGELYDNPVEFALAHPILDVMKTLGVSF